MFLVLPFTKGIANADGNRTDYQQHLNQPGFSNQHERILIIHVTLLMSYLGVRPCQ